MSRFLTVDRIVGLALLAACCLYTYFAFDLVNSIPPFFRDQPMRMDTFPRVLGIAGIIASVVAILAPNTGTSAKPVNEKQKDSEERMADLTFANLGESKWGQLAVMIALLIAYAAFLRPGGFILTTFIMLFTGSLILGERRWLAMILVSAIAPVAIWCLVTFVLDRTIPPLPAFLAQAAGA